MRSTIIINGSNLRDHQVPPTKKCSGKPGIASPTVTFRLLFQTWISVLCVGFVLTHRTPANAAQHGDCNATATLGLPASGTGIAFPRMFSWSLSGTCPAVQIAFATSEFPDAAYVTDTFTGGSATISVEHWNAIKAILNPQGGQTTFYWTVVESDLTTFMELAPWRPFHTGSRLVNLSATPDSGGARPAGSPLPLAINVGYDVLATGVMQVTVTSDQQSETKWEPINAAGTGTKTFNIPVNSVISGSRYYQIAVRFRPNATVGPLVGDLSGDLVGSISSYLIHWTASADNTTPSIQITSPSAADTYATTSGVVVLEGTASDNIGVVLVNWDNGRGMTGTAAGTSHWSTPAILLQPGANTLTVTARDAAGNLTSDSILINYTQPDPNAPVILINSPTTDDVFKSTRSTITLGGSATSTSALAEVSWTNDRGGSGTAVGTTTWTIPNILLQPGLNQIYVSARAYAGATSSDYLVVDYTPADEISPTIAISSPTSGTSWSTGSGFIVLAGFASDNVGVVELSWTNDRGGTGTIANQPNWTTPAIPLQTGVNLVTVRARDALGNTATDTLSITYIPLDTTAPVVTVTSPTTQPVWATSSASINLSGIASDNRSVTGVTWTTDRGGFGIATGIEEWSVTGIILQAGNNLITIQAEDAAGNVGRATLQVVYTPADTIPPSITINSPTFATTLSVTTPTITLGGYASDNLGIHSVIWENDRGETGRATGTTSWSTGPIELRPGANLIAVIVEDIAGNLASDHITVTYRAADAEAPSIQITLPTTAEAMEATASSLVLKGTAADNLGVVEVKWSNDRGGSGVATGTTSWTTDSIPLQGGVNILTVTARDAAGNSKSDTLRVTYAPLDTTPPSITINSPTFASAITVSTGTIALGGFASDNDGLLHVAWANDRGDSGTATGTTTWNVPNIALLPGVNNLVVTATDRAGNTATDSLAVTYAPPDVTAPQVAISSPTHLGSVSVTSRFLTLGGTSLDDTSVTSVRWASDRGGNGEATGTTSWSVAGVELQPGDNVITITARDAAGNTGQASLRATYNPPVNTPPTLAILSPSSTGTFTTADALLTITGTADDDGAVTRIEWSNNHGAFGIATGLRNWSIGPLSLPAGATLFVIRATDNQSGVTTTTLSVVLEPPATAEPTAPVANDFNRDGFADLLLQHTSGTIACWSLQGTTVAEVTHPYKLPAGWSLVGAADFNADQQTDLVLQHSLGFVAIWMLEGTTIKESVMTAKADTGWKVMGTGDFDGDGQPDLVLQHSGGTIGFWLMDGAVRRTHVPSSTVPSNWRIGAIADFNADGRPDLVLQDNTGLVEFWLMNGMVSQQRLRPFTTSAGWEIRGSGQFGGGASVDLVLQHTNGTVGYWIMDGIQIQSSHAPYSVEADWLISGPR